MSIFDDDNFADEKVIIYMTNTRKKQVLSTSSRLFNLNQVSQPF